MSNIIESFTIPIYEYKTVDAGKNTIRIKGVALRGDIVSKNNRKYTREALLKATNTWIGKPINVNHDDAKKVGTIKWMDYDTASDSLLYEAEINNPTYVTLLRNKSTEIRGLSIQADYLHTVCSRCGKKFYTEDDWFRHVTEEEFMRNMPTEPHGIVGTAISLVLSPEIPGYDGTTYELAEIAKRETLRLLETVIKNKQEQENYVLSRIALDKSSGNIAVGKSGVQALAEQDEEPQAEPEACPEGQHRNEEGKCVPDEPKEEVTEQENNQCGEDEHWSETDQKCVKNAPPEATELLKVKLKPFRASESAPKLKLGEPFAGYDNFEDCVAKNSEKDNPEAYCGTIKKEAEGSAAEKKATVEKLNEIIGVLNSLEVPGDDLSWKHIKPYNDKELREKINAIKPYNDKELRERLEAIKPYDDADLQKKVAEALLKIPELEEKLTAQKTDFEQVLAVADKNIDETRKTLEERIEVLNKENQELKEKKLKETQDLTGKVTEIETKLDNALDKQQGTFKGVAVKPKEQEKKADPDLSYKPGGKN